MKEQSIFIAGTDTGVGKTIITGFIGKFFSRCNYKVITQKWVQTGLHSDINVHFKIMHKNKNETIKYNSLICPYHFYFSSSPHLAALLEKKIINKKKIKDSFLGLKKNFDFIIIEGTGGILVPLSESLFMIDIVKDINLNVILVVGNKIGAINHTLLSIEALKKRKIKISGIIFNNFKKNCNPKILKDNPAIIKKLTGETILGVLPYIKDKDLLYQKFIPIGNNLIKMIKNE